MGYLPSHRIPNIAITMVMGDVCPASWAIIGRTATRECGSGGLRACTLRGQPPPQLRARDAHLLRLRRGHRHGAPPPLDPCDWYVAGDRLCWIYKTTPLRCRHFLAGRRPGVLACSSAARPSLQVTSYLRKPLPRSLGTPKNGRKGTLP